MTRADRQARGAAVRPRLTDQDRYWRSVPEKDVVRAVLDYCHSKGGYAWRNNAGAVTAEHNGKRRYVQFGEKGMADIIAVMPYEILFHSRCESVVLFIECKDETGKQSDAQRDWQAAVEAAGGVYVVCRPSDWQERIDAVLGEQHDNER